MVDSDRGMQDTVVRVSGPWDADWEDEHVAVLVVWNLNVGTCVGTLPAADVEAKLRKLTTVDFNNRNWSWLLNSNRPSVPLVILRVPATGKGQLAPKPEKSVQKESNSDSETEESTRGVSQTVVNPGKPRVLGEMVPDKKRALAQSLHLPRPGDMFWIFFRILFVEIIS